MSEAVANPRPGRIKAGYAVSFVGLAGFIPSILTAVFSDEYRRIAALLTLFFWLVWFVGKTLIKTGRDTP